MDLVVCWRCEQPGHGYAECDRQPPATRAETEKRVARYIERRIEGRISTAHKRLWIADEWKALREVQAKAKEKAK